MHLPLQHHRHGTAYLTMSVTVKVTPIFLSQLKTTILTLHFMTYHLLVVLFNYTLYGASELRMGGAIANPDVFLILCFLMLAIEFSMNKVDYSTVRNGTVR